MRDYLEVLEFVVYAPEKITVDNPYGMRDIPEMVDWLDELGNLEDDMPAYSMALRGHYVYFAREEDELAFRLKFDIW